MDFSSGFSQLPLDEESRGLFNIILPWAKYRFCVLPQRLNVSPEIFDIKTSKNIGNETGVYKNADDVMGGGQKLEELDVRMRKVFQVCRERNKAEYKQTTVWKKSQVWGHDD